MNNRGYFVLGCKVFGIYCLFMGLPHLISAFEYFLNPIQMSDELRQVLILTRITTVIIPIAYITAGIYLLRDGKYIHNFAYPKAEIDDLDDRKEKFKLFIKMLGMYLIVIYTPDLLKSISSYLTYTNAPKFYDMFQQRNYTYINLFSSLGAILLGFYLLKSGEFFKAWVRKQ